MSAHWVYSITTRIKTLLCIVNEYTFALIEYIPLQQGLRLDSLARFSKSSLLIEYIPLQQGLRQEEKEA